LGTYHVTVDFNDNLMGNYSVDGEFHGIFMWHNIVPSRCKTTMNSYESFTITMSGWCF
jgi:hypothetical protein